MNNRCMLRFFDRARLLVLVLTLSATSIVAGCSHNEADAERLATMLQVRPGMVVADVGAGKGRMTVVMATLVVPKVHVFSTEIDPRSLDKIRKAIKAEHLDNVTVVQTTASNTGLPADCC